MADSWGIEPDVLKRECAGCGRNTFVNRRTLCDQCEDEFDADMREIEAHERTWDDATARRAYYNG